jgi:hypothetical protein
VAYGSLYPAMRVHPVTREGGGGRGTRCTTPLRGHGRSCVPSRPWKRVVGLAADWYPCRGPQAPQSASRPWGGPGIRQLPRGHDALPEAVAQAPFAHTALAWGRSRLRMAGGSSSCRVRRPTRMLITGVTCRCSPNMCHDPALTPGDPTGHHHDRLRRGWGRQSLILATQMPYRRSIQNPAPLTDPTYRPRRAVVCRILLGQAGQFGL